MTAKISFAFAKLSDSPLITKADHILGRMEKSAAYPTPNPPLAALQAGVSKFQDSLAAAVDGGKLKTAQKNAAREELLEILRALALYVQQTCKGDLTTLLCSGFDAQKERAPVGELPPPHGVTLTQTTMTGQLELRAEPVPNAASYIAQYTTKLNDPDSWVDCGYPTGARIKIDDLTPGTLYYGRMRAIGTAGPSAWSEPVSAYAI